MTLKGCSHITGGGFYENIPRMLPEGVHAVVKKDSYEVPAIFKLIAEKGDIAEQMMYNTFNMGLGMVIGVDPADVDKTMKLLEEAGEKLADVLEKVTISELQIPYVTNVTAEFVKDHQKIRSLLAKQISSPVKWQQSVEAMIAEGVDTFVEIGPGKTLAGFMRKINRNVKVYNVQTIEDIEKVVQECSRK